MSHSHHHGHGHGCCPEEHDSSCCSHHHHDCGHETHSHEHKCTFAQDLLELADEAWMELLKDKIKEKIEATGGQSLDALAELVSNSNHERWKNRIGGHRSAKEFEQTLADFFNKGK